MMLNTTEATVAAAAKVLPTGNAVVDVANPWPWLALGAVLLILIVIARFSRRHLPFGQHF